MSIKKYSSGSWVTVPYRKYETATDTITSLPKTIIGDGQPISSYTIKGNMTQSGTPTPSNPIYPTECGDKTANLLDIADFTVQANAGSQDKILWKGNMAVGNYTISLYQEDTLTGSERNRIGIKINDVLTYSEGGTANFHNEAGLHSLQFSISNATDYVEIRYWTHTLSNTCTYSNVMTNTGSTALPYEPYGQYKIPILSNGVAYPIYLSEPLRKIGDSVDIAPSTGTATRILAKQILTGTESVVYNGKSSPNQIYVVTTAASSAGTTTASNVISSHFETKTATSQTALGGIAMRSNGTDFLIGIGYDTLGLDDTATTAQVQTATKAWLADQYANGTPVTVWYVLPTATTESFTAPSIPTSGSPQSFDVSTTLKPSEVSLTWHGWHEHSDKKKSANLFDKDDNDVLLGYEISNGNIREAENWFVSGYIPVEYGKTYCKNISSGLGVIGYNANKEKIYGGGFDSSTNTITIIDNDLKYLRINNYISNIDQYMLNKGSTALPYEPYWE